MYKMKGPQVFISTIVKTNSAVKLPETFFKTFISPEMSYLLILLHCHINLSTKFKFINQQKNDYQ